LEREAISQREKAFVAAATAIVVRAIRRLEFFYDESAPDPSPSRWRSKISAQSSRARTL